MNNVLVAAGGMIVFIAGVYLYRTHTDRELASVRLMRDMAAVQSGQGRPVPPHTRPQNSILSDGAAESASPSGALSDIPAAWAAGPERRRLDAIGKQVYRAHCAACHGADGSGKTPAAAAEGMPAIVPFTDEKYAHMSLGKIYSGICLGVGNMPAFGNKLSIREIWGAALQVRRLRDGESSLNTASPDDEP